MFCSPWIVPLFCLASPAGRDELQEESLNGVGTHSHNERRRRSAFKEERGENALFGTW